MKLKPTDLKTLRTMLIAKKLENTPRPDEPLVMVGGWGRGSGRRICECREIKALERAIDILSGNK